MSDRDVRYFMIRAMRQTEADFEIFFKKAVVAVGWSKVRFSDYDDATELARKVEATYYPDGTTSTSVVGRKRNEVVRFKGMSAGDRIVVPHYDKVCFATVQNGELFDETASSDEIDLGNQRRVIYLRSGSTRFEISRKELREGLQRRLSVRGSTVADLGEFALELSHYWNEERQVESAWDVELSTAREKAEAHFKDLLLQDIQLGRTKLPAGGRGLEVLVKDLLECEGFTAHVLSKRTFKSIGDADVIASRSDRIMGAQRVLVQVKHHSGTTDDWGAKQLAEIGKSQPNEFGDCKQILVTSGNASNALREACDAQDITLITGSELVVWIVEMLDKLSVETKQKLGVVEVSRLKSELV
jgi:restriction system protein